MSRLAKAKRCVLVPESMRDPQLVVPQRLVNVSLTTVEHKQRDEKQPLVELSLTEMIAVQRWLKAAQADVILQVELAAQDKRVSKRAFLQQKQAAECVTAWLVSALVTFEQMLQIQAAVETNHLLEDAIPEQS